MRPIWVTFIELAGSRGAVPKADLFWSSSPDVLNDTVKVLHSEHIECCLAGLQVQGPSGGL